MVEVKKDGQADISSVSTSGVPDVNDKNSLIRLVETGGGKGTENQDTQAGSEDTPDKDPDKDVPFHKHPRFKELINQKNTLESTVRDLQQKLSEIQAKVQAGPAKETEVKVPSRIDKMIERRVALGMTEPEARQDVADYLAELDDRVNTVINKEVVPLKETTAQNQLITAIDSRLESFKKELKERGEDYGKYQKQMKKLFDDLSPEWRKSIALDESGKGLEMLYQTAKNSAQEPDDTTVDTTGGLGGRKTGDGAGDGIIKASWVRKLTPSYYAANKEKIDALVQKAYAEGRYVQD